MGLSAEQLEMRRTGVTATDMVVLAGEGHANASALSIYNDKIGVGAPWEGNRATRVGEHTESLIMDFLAEEKGLLLTQGVTERHAIFPWLLATPDRNVIRHTEGVDAKDSRIAIAEAKCVGYRMAGKWMDDVVPPANVVIQVTVGMMVTGTRTSHVAALLGTEPKFYEVEFNQPLADALLDLADTFWNKNVLTRTPPKPDGSEGSSKALGQLYRTVKGDTLKATKEVEMAARVYFEAKSRMEEAKKIVDAAENQMKAFIADNAGTAGDGWNATWSPRKGSVSWKNAFEELAPKVSPMELERFRSESTRIFSCKAVK